mmetsp:Transcript_19294/g.77212  ORF Transcript_19294/g.77212 Transcript_19294/m.77212 type:complete len:256 (-) Transcript_19294:180-947(-)
MFGVLARRSGRLYNGFSRSGSVVPDLVSYDTGMKLGDSQEEDVDPARAEFDASFFERSILVQRLKLSTLPKAVKTHFEQVGEVLIADVLRRPSGKSLGTAIVEYAEPKAAKEALEKLQGTKLEEANIYLLPNKRGLERGERTLAHGRIKRFLPRAEFLKLIILLKLVGLYPMIADPKPSKVVYLEHLPRTMTDGDLRHLGQKFGKVLDAQKVLGKDGKTIRAGFIKFSSNTEATKAVKMLDERMLHGFVISAQLH